MGEGKNGPGGGAARQLLHDRSVAPAQQAGWGGVEMRVVTDG